MNLETFTDYVNLDVDDSFYATDIEKWVNKAIAYYNLMPPVTIYGSFDGDVNDFETQYGWDDTFMLAILLPFVASSVRSQDSSLSEKQLFLQEYFASARTYKSIANIPSTYLKNQQNTDLDVYQLGENVYVSDFRTSPFGGGNWKSGNVYTEIVDEDEET